jgi:hypothetical protein
MNKSSLLFASSVLCIVVAAWPAEAQRGGGRAAGGARAGGGTAVRSSGRTNVSSNRNVNANVNRNVNVDVHNHGGYRGYGGYRGGGCCYHPVAAGVAVGATAAVTAAAIGSVVYSLPSSCSTVVVSGMAYQECGGSYYQPQISGSSTTYVVVNPPQ